MIEFAPATGNAPNMQILRERFHHGTDHLMPGPYFIGYCGEYHSQYPGVVQLAGCSVAGRGEKPYHLSILRSKVLGLHLEASVSNPQSRHRARLNEESRHFHANICIPPPTSQAFTRIRGRMNAVTPSMACYHIL